VVGSQDERAAWLRLTLIPGIGGDAQRALLKSFAGPANVFSATHTELARVVDRPRADLLLSYDATAAIDAALAWANEEGSHLVPLGDPHYPALLLQTHDPPTLLYVRGRPEMLCRPAFAIVGSRNATAAGRENAERFARALSDAGFAIVSGLALGIDAAAHRGGLAGAGSSVAVIGTGADRVYPAANQALARRIAQAGAVVSEFALGTPARPGHFPRRNRIIAGLSSGVLVVEAALGSGSLITAGIAAELGREVFALPGSIHSPLAKGCHRLIKQGAKLVEDANDILEELQSGKAAASPIRTAAPSDHPILIALGFEPCDLDTLAARTGLEPGRLSAALLELELDGQVSSLPGGRFHRR
jgi:DNA processing protein